MSPAYDPQMWQTLYAFVGAAAATLTGLLAVALSINPKRIMSTPTHAARSREALIAFLILILLSILMLIPGQAPTFLGTELVILGLCGLAAAFSLQYRTLGLLHKSLRKQWLARIALLDSGSAFLVIGGLSLLLVNGGAFTGLFQQFSFV